MWKDNFLVDGNPTTLEGFLDDVFGFNIVARDFDLFRFCLAYFKDVRDIFRTGLYLDEKDWLTNCKTLGSIR